MRARELSGQTLNDVIHEVNSHNGRIWGGAAFEIGLHLDEDEPFFTLGDNEVPAFQEGLEALAVFADIPQKFIMRVDPDEQQWILNNRLQRISKPDTTIYWDDNGIHEVRPAGETRVKIENLVESVGHIFPADAPIDNWWWNTEEFRLEVVFPLESFTEYSGGDPEVGDITQGGVRVGQDRKHNLAPWVQPYLLRLQCTNGLEVPDHGIRVEARKATEQQVVSLFRHEVRRAVDRVSDDIKAFYALREQRFDQHGSTVVMKVAREAGLPERTVRDLGLTFPETDGVTMFDVVNHITERANGMSPHSPASRKLQIAGGSRVYDHAQRCRECLSRLG